MTWDTIWNFHTARFSIALECTYDDDADLSWADTDTVDKLERGIYGVYCFRVRVLFDGEEIGSDYLGDSVYENVFSFAKEHRDPDPMNRNCSIMRAKNGQNTSICHYFPGMVSEAIRSARKYAAKLSSIGLRAV